MNNNDTKTELENKKSLKTSQSNPLSSGKGVIDNVGGIIKTQVHSTTNKLYSGYKANYSRNHSVSDISEIITLLNEAMSGKSQANDVFSAIHNVFISKLNCFYTAMGLLNPQTNCINIKLIDKIGSVYSTRILTTDDDNPIAQVFNNKKYKLKRDNSFLNLPYLINSTIGIYPLMAGDNSVGVYIIGDNMIDQHTIVYDMVAKYLGLFTVNNQLKELSESNSNIDTLTNLYNHGKFQEILSDEIEKAKQSNNNLAVVMLDISNTTQINKEFGHAKGDEIIKTVADKVKQTIGESGYAGRYGGDEIAIILPNTDKTEAKYLAEYISYALSCCMIDEVGPIKVSIGLSNYPTSAQEQDKLLILAEQAMYVSMSKGYENGIPAIISSDDYGFWDDMALKSFASIIAKRHNQIGLNFDEELMNKFTSEDIKSQNQLIEVVTSLAAAIDAKDTYTKGHSASVSRYAEALARAINLPEKEVERIKLGAMLHDVGKIGIPENVLRKPTGLNDEEWEIMKQHPMIGAEKVLMPNPSLHDLIPIAKHHHEHWDGTGYPSGLKGEEIPLAARIVAVADSYHALISDRPYRKGLGIKKACEILQMGAGVQWDKELVRSFIAIAPSLSVSY